MVEEHRKLDTSNEPALWYTTCEVGKGKVEAIRFLNIVSETEVDFAARYVASRLGD